MNLSRPPGLATCKYLHVCESYWLTYLVLWSFKVCWSILRFKVHLISCVTFVRIGNNLNKTETTVFAQNNNGRQRQDKKISMHLDFWVFFHILLLTEMCRNFPSHSFAIYFLDLHHVQSFNQCERVTTSFPCYLEQELCLKKVTIFFLNTLIMLLRTEKTSA